MSILQRVSGIVVCGRWLRSVPLMRPDLSLSGSTRGGRWLPACDEHVLYLGTPDESIVIEMYRHLVDDAPEMDGSMVAPRLLLETQVDARNILDLTSPALARALGLKSADFTSAVGEYDRCQRVGQEALESGFHGILAPAATARGTTLALFVDRLTSVESVDRPREVDVWNGLPQDPREDDEDRDGLGWHRDALCAKTDPEVHFPERGGSTREAKAICMRCSVRVTCLNYALENDERFGIWGGLTERERRKLTSPMASRDEIRAWEHAADLALAEADGGCGTSRRGHSRSR